VITLALRATSLAGVAALILSDSGTLALWGVLLTSLTSLIAQWMRARHEDRRDAQRHAWDEEDREAARVYRAEIRSGIAENTALTRVGVDKAEAAYIAGNHVADKLQAIQATALALDRAVAVETRAELRKDIAESRHAMEREGVAKQTTLTQATADIRQDIADDGDKTRSVVVEAREAEK
jgi:hypothetical protein